MRAVLVLALALTLAGCGFDTYCIDCERPGAGADGSAGVDGGGNSDGDFMFDAPDVDACAPSGIEVCNGVDEDCDGLIDELPLAMVGDPCGTDEGPCVAGAFECTGGEIVCGAGAVAAMPESCNDVDDDCDGTVDDGNPGGGIPCGSDSGECQRGVTLCDPAGDIVCDGEVTPTPELCNSKDDDCDGMYDELNPQGGADCGEALGECDFGTVTCSGGALQCVGGTGPQFEFCNDLDDDCDDDIDEIYDFNIDPNRCGDCTTVCSFPNALPRCNLGTCELLACNTGWWDRDPIQPGCEYGPCTFGGQEVCNGKDDDCNPATTEAMLPPPTTLCAKLGVCAGTIPTCTGTGGWKCMYPATASTNLMGNLIPETNCDNLDNDCNNIVDDAFPARLEECHKGIGACETDGQYVCSGGTALVCNAATPGMGNPESCNGQDDDCDGMIDDGAPDNWVQAGAFWIYAYEASRPDATALLAGSATHRSCSNSGRVPWTNITYDNAQTACAGAGGRLCTEAEWRSACRGPSSTCNWSFASSCATYAETTCNGNDYDFDPGTVADEDAVRITGFLASCYTDWTGLHIHDLSGNVKEWTEERSAGVNPLRGGSYNNTGLGISCDWDFVVASDTFQFENVGFRCCRSTAP